MDRNLIKEIQSRKVSKLLKESEDIVISGIGGRFPMSNNTDEFAHNLFNNIDMITEDDNEERWPKCKHYKLNDNYKFILTRLIKNIQLVLYGMNTRMGRVKDIDKFDGSFFGFLSKHADEMDAESRILLETTYEAIVDAGKQIF